LCQAQFGWGEDRPKRLFAGVSFIAAERAAVERPCGTSAECTECTASKDFKTQAGQLRDRSRALASGGVTTGEESRTLRVDSATPLGGNVEMAVRFELR
jgi:hypothetical protein